MFSVRLDQSRNALTVSYDGKVTREETRLCAEEVRLTLPILQPNVSIDRRPDWIAIDGSFLFPADRPHHGNMQRRRRLRGRSHHSRSHPRHWPANHVVLPLPERRLHSHGRERGRGDR